MMGWRGIARLAAVGWLLLILLLALSVSRRSYTEISREAPDSRPSREHWLGTDALSRDRFSRMAAGTRVSLLAAPGAALIATLLAAGAGVLCGLGPGWVSRPLSFICDLFIALPWLFLLIALRAMVPLNTSPEASILITFLSLGALGWPGPARVVKMAARQALASDYYLQARASGMTPLRIARIHIACAVRPVLLAQFWTAVPVFILNEVNLSLIGLGVSEPLPSWGAILRDFERPDLIASNPEIVVTLVVLVVTILCSQRLFGRRVETA